MTSAAATTATAAALGPRPAPDRWRRLAGEFFDLEPVRPEVDGPELFALSHGSEAVEAVWRFMPYGPFASCDAMIAHFKSWSERPDVVCYVVRDCGSSKAVGSVSLMAIRPEHGVAEVGSIWYTPSAQRTKANTEACHLMLSYCFEELGYRRVEWKCDHLNAPSRRAALRLGFEFEGTFRQHMIVKGANRDTDWFAIVDKDWARRVRAAHRTWLYESGSDSRSLRDLLIAPPASSLSSSSASSASSLSSSSLSSSSSAAGLG